MSSSSSQTLSSKPASSEEPSTEATSLPAQDGEDTQILSSNNGDDISAHISSPR